jgi:DHA2 family multidrug resistance protein-like MFS transporter
LGLSVTDFSSQQTQAWILMALLGFSAASALLSSTAAIMAAAPKEKAAAAGAIETMAYELGAGLGIALFGLILTRSFSSSITLPAGLNDTQAALASSSIGEAFQLAQEVSSPLAEGIRCAARTAFVSSHSVALSAAGIMLMLLAVGVWLSLKGVDKQASKDG